MTVNRGLGSRATDLANFLDDLEHLALHRQSSGFQTLISGLKADWFNGAGADGANWVIAALRKETTSTFPPASTAFEVATTIGNNVRRYDAIADNAVLINDIQRKRYFEFKSYNSVPPADFADQFVKDLTNPDIEDLSQLRWYFDAAKNPLNFEDNMKKAIDGLDLSDQSSAFFSKYGSVDEITFKAKIKTNFSTIFLLK